MHTMSSIWRGLDHVILRSSTYTRMYHRPVMQEREKVDWKPSSESSFKAARAGTDTGRRTTTTTYWYLDWRSETFLQNSLQFSLFVIRTFPHVKDAIGLLLQAKRKIKSSTFSVLYNIKKKGIIIGLSRSPFSKGVSAAVRISSVSVVVK